MRKAFAVAIASLVIAPPAGAAVTTLEGISSVSDGFRFDYQGTLGPDEGVTSGSRFVIFDFGGYVDGSIFAPSSFVGSVEFTTDVSGFILPPNTDDPTIENLVFTYAGPDLRTVDGPFEALDFDGFGAVSIFNQTRQDGFTSFTIKNNPDGTENTLLIQVGMELVPFAPVPEPATWAMMIGGFGLVGAAMRRSRLRTLAV